MKLYRSFPARAWDAMAMGRRLERAPSFIRNGAYWAILMGYRVEDVLLSLHMESRGRNPWFIRYVLSAI